jgi:integrase
MKLIDREKVDGTGVTIGRRVVGSIQVSTFTAVYKEVDGNWRQDSLGISDVRKARRMAIEIQQRLESSKIQVRHKPQTIRGIVARYYLQCRRKGLAPTSLVKYRSDLRKLRRFCRLKKIKDPNQFTEERFYQFREWQQHHRHKQGTVYSPKSIYATLTLTKQVTKWAVKAKLIPQNHLADISIPIPKPRPQPCFTIAQIDRLLEVADESEKTAFATLAFSGMRIGELEQLDWADVLLDRGTLGMLHIRRGGSAGTTKDKDERFVPIHPRVRPLLEVLPHRVGLVFPHATERALLGKLKRQCEACGFGNKLKLHSFRHFFASLCANNHVAYRKALAWLGHSSSDILDLYYHLHDEESDAAMQALATSRERQR